MGSDVREKETLQNFRSWCEERNWTIGGGNQGGLTGFWDRKDSSFLPHRRKLGLTDGQIEEVG